MEIGIGYQLEMMVFIFNIDGRILYVAQFNHDNGLVVGKTTDAMGHFAYGGKEHICRGDYLVLAHI